MARKKFVKVLREVFERKKRKYIGLLPIGGTPPPPPPIARIGKFPVFSSATGWSIMTVKKYELIAQAKKKPINLVIRPFHHYIGTFWYLVSKKCDDHPVIIHLEILLRCETVQIWKIHWKLKYSESRYCFAIPAHHPPGTLVHEMAAWK